MKLLLVALLVVGSRAAPLDELPVPSATVASVDLKKPTEVPKVEDPKLSNSNTAGPSMDMKPGNSIENAPENEANKGEVDKRFLLPGFGLGSAFGGYRGLQGPHGGFPNLANIGNFGNFADHVRGYGAYGLGGVGGGPPVNIGLPGAYFG